MAKVRIRLLTEAEQIARAARKQAETSRLDAIRDHYQHKQLTLLQSVSTSVAH